MDDRGNAGASSAPPVDLRILLILPCFNESKSLGPLLREIVALNRGYQTLVIDDGSTDSTAAVARPLSRCVSLIRNLGIGGAVQTGIMYAWREGYDYCVQVDGDGQHDPAQISVLLDKQREANSNIVIGSRFCDPVSAAQGYTSSSARRVGISLISHVLHLLFGQRFTDPTSGFRLMDRTAMSLFAQTYPHDFPEPISIAKACRAGLRVSEVPVRMRPRQMGVSSINGFKTVSYMVRVVGYIALAYLQHNQKKIR